MWDDVKLPPSAMDGINAIDVKLPPSAMDGINARKCRVLWDVQSDLYLTQRFQAKIIHSSSNQFKDHSLYKMGKGSLLWRCMGKR